MEIDDVAVAAVPWLRALAGALMPPPPPLRRWLGRAVPRRAAAALRAGSDGGREGEAMVVVACHPDTRDARLRAAALACALPAPADSAVVEVRGEPRRTPVAKVAGPVARARGRAGAWAAADGPAWEQRRASAEGCWRAGRTRSG